jgi:hypothetical protein
VGLERLHVSRRILADLEASDPVALAIYLASGLMWIEVVVHPGGGRHNPNSASATLASFAPMVLAMSLPLAVSTAVAVRRTAFWHRRYDIPTVFAIGFAATWVIFALTVVDLQQIFGIPGSSPIWTAACAALAAGWSTRRVRSLVDRRYRERIAVPAWGLEASKGACATGLGHGKRSLLSHGPTMLVMASCPRLAMMIALAVLSGYEARRGPNPFHDRRKSATTRSMTAIAVSAAAIAVLAG